MSVVAKILSEKGLEYKIKTAVLSERVLDFVLSGGDINKLLVVTFTDAAANEMKKRILALALAFVLIGLYILVLLL